LYAPKQLPTCNDLEGLRDALNLALPESILEAPATRVLEFRVDRAPDGGFVADITAKELDGRVIDSLHETYPHVTECFKVLHKIAVATPVWLSELDGAFEKAPTPAPPAQPPCPACTPPPPPPPKPVPIERRVFLGAGGFVSLGVAPTTLVGLQLAGGFRAFRSWSFDFALRGTFPATALPLEWTPVRVQSILSFAAAPCYRIGVFGACIVGLFSNMWVESLTLTKSPVDTAQFVGIGPRIFLDKRLTDRWSVRLDAEVIIPLLFAGFADEALARWDAPLINGNANASFFAWF
jgi:hypothetical protein